WGIQRQVVRDLLRIEFIGVFVGKVRQKTTPIGCFPPEQPVRELGVVRGPQQLAGHEIINARFLVDLWKLPVVSKRIRVPADLDVSTKVLLKISFADKNLTHQRL